MVEDSRLSPVAFPGKYDRSGASQSVSQSVISRSRPALTPPPALASGATPGLWSLTGRQRPRWWPLSLCVCAVAPVHSSVELSMENSIRLSADYNAQQYVIYWLSNGSGFVVNRSKATARRFWRATLRHQMSTKVRMCHDVNRHSATAPGRNKAPWDPKTIPTRKTSK